MKRHRVVLGSYALGLLVMLCSCSLSATAQEQVAVIVNPSNNISSLSAGDLHRIFTGDKSTWPNGKHIFVIMAAPGSAERTTILKSVFKMSETEYAKYFLQAAFTGAVSAPPKDASSVAEIRQLVAANPEAIGYVKAQDADNSVKVVLKVP